MDGKKPVWVTEKAHEALKQYCAATGRTQVSVTSELIYKKLGGSMASGEDLISHLLSVSGGEYRFEKVFPSGASVCVNTGAPESVDDVCE